MKANINTSLNFREHEYSFILKLAEQCASNGGFQISRSEILRVLIRLLQHLKVDISGVKTEDQLLQRLQGAV